MTQATDGQEERPARARPVKANSAGAKRSAGRASVERAAKAPRRALPDGLWAARGIAIPRGNFAESELAVGEFLTAVIDDLAPHGALQEAQAFNIAMQQWRLLRLTRFESEALSGVGRPRKGPAVSEASELVEHSYAIETADWLVGARARGDVDFARVLVFLMSEFRISAEDAARLFGDEPAPDQSGFERMSRALLTDQLPVDTDPMLWAIGVAARWEQVLTDAIARREEEARKGLREDLDFAARVHQRTNRELQRALRDYALMRSGETG